jgi:hypothetical protein
MSEAIVLKFINSVRQKLSFGKVQCLELPEILETVDAGQLGAVRKVECSEAFERRPPFALLAAFSFGVTP